MARSVRAAPLQTCLLVRVDFIVNGDNPYAAQPGTTRHESSFGVGFERADHESMKLEYRDGRTAEARILAIRNNEMRLAIKGGDDAEVIRYVKGEWRSRDRRSVTVIFGSPKRVVSHVPGKRLSLNFDDRLQLPIWQTGLMAHGCYIEGNGMKAAQALHPSGDRVVCTPTQSGAMSRRTSGKV